MAKLEVVHIWSFAAGLSAIYNGEFLDQFCQCAQTNAPSPPSFVGNDYFCESGNEIPGHTHIFYHDPLWDGQNCAGAANTCCQLNGPPYFTKTLPTSTTDDIELRLMCGECRGAF